MRMGIIYKATSLSSKVYIGQTIQTLSQRKSGHFCSAFDEDRSGYNTKFYRAIRKYGRDGFVWDIIYDNIPYKELSKLEIKTIAEYNSYKIGYNSTEGGQKDISYETITKLSRAGFDRPCSKETRAKISRANKGRVMSKEAIKKISKSNIGENNSAAKLNWNKVNEIRKLHDQGKSGVYLATKYNVYPSTISCIILNKTWTIK